jgi:23S rRNA (cytidine1920-2'-O)/16S rRNA (cytidine1409-2'-O)-methyltransferase
VTRRRLDAELVRRGLVTSREQGRTAIEQGRVTVAGNVATKAASQVDDASAIELREALDSRYVSRGAHKLIGALDAFGVDVAGVDALDAGASTGGFTQVLLERGAARVLAVDVGYGQLAWPLRSDERVTVLERTNVRYLADARGDGGGNGSTVDNGEPHESVRLPFTPNLVVADLSFISLRLVLPALVAVAGPKTEFLLMVKPQFEVGKESVGSGVVTDPNLRIEAVSSVAESAHDLGLGIFGCVASPLPGPKGNVEYFLWMKQAVGDLNTDSGNDVQMDAAATHAAIVRAVEEGPQ